MKITNPLILPLRRVLPPIGKVDTASVVAVLLVAALRVAAHALNDEGIGAPFLGSGVHTGILWASAIAGEIFYMVLWIYFYAIILYALLAHDRPGRLLAAAIAAREPVRAGAAAAAARDPLRWRVWICRRCGPALIIQVLITCRCCSESKSGAKQRVAGAHGASISDSVVVHAETHA